MQEEFLVEMLLRLYLFFCQSFLHRTGRSAAIPTGAACHRGCCPVSSGAQCLYNPFSWDLKPKFPFIPPFLNRDSRRCWRGGPWQLAGDAHVSPWPLPPPQPPAACTPGTLCTVFPTFPIPGTSCPLGSLFLNQPSCALAEVGAGLGTPLDPTREGDGVGEVKTHRSCIRGPDGFDSWGDGPRSHKLRPSGAHQAPSLGPTASSRVLPSVSWLRLFGLVSGGRSSGAVSGIKQKMFSPGVSWFARKASRKAFCSSEVDFGIW